MESKQGVDLPSDDIVIDPRLTDLEFLDQLECNEDENSIHPPPPEIQAMLAKGIPNNFTWDG